MEFNQYYSEEKAAIILGVTTVRLNELIQCGLLRVVAFYDTADQEGLRLFDPGDLDDFAWEDVGPSEAEEDELEEDGILL